MIFRALVEFAPGRVHCRRSWSRQELAAAEGPEYFAFSKIGIRLRL